VQILGILSNLLMKQPVKKEDGRKNNVPSQEALEASLITRRFNVELRNKKHEIDMEKLKREELKVKLDTEEKEAELEWRRQERLDAIMERYEEEGKENPIAAGIKLFLEKLPAAIEAIASKQKTPSGDPSPKTTIPINAVPKSVVDEAIASMTPEFREQFKTAKKEEATAVSEAAWEALNTEVPDIEHEQS